ncbi:cyclin-dependent protein kinase inhibitor [Boletus reticuloceps]|uniref:Peroxisome assembly protein 12 n=1 Tax=Boletus reticuloceps TaxID=495285 RepID=A0A8I2YX09_9AGAM|nr:cyclin-dependent protein kinase inhibitor [Boletus reticuloceps]
MDFLHDLGGDPLKPSLFELIAQEQLRDLLQPALKYVLAVFAQRYPRYLIRIVNRHEEFYATIMFFVELHSLRKHSESSIPASEHSPTIPDASFAENFYGLKRRRHPWIPTDRATAAVRGAPAAEKLRGREKWQSLFFLVALPYLRAKTHDYYEQLGGGVSLDMLEDAGDGRRIQTLTDDSLAGRWRRAYKKIFPCVNTSFELWLLACNVAYLFEHTPFYRPWLAWIGVDLRRLNADDFLATSHAQGAMPRDRRGIIKQLYQLLMNSPQLILDSLRLLLPTAILFIKFLEWWYSPGSPARSLSISPLGPVVPPPRMLQPHPRGIPVDGTMFGHCPMCQNTINNATALPSGYVFCYRCAYNHVEQHGKCPVTLLPAKFGKQIQSEQVPGWSAYYLDYKFLKKIISSLAANRPASEAAALALGVRPADLLNPTVGPAITISSTPTAISPDDPNQLPILSSLGQDNDRGADFQAHKAAFFFKLERELEKINTFYLQKEAELKLRLETLLSKRRAAALRGLPDATDGSAMNYVEWIAVEEGFRLLERDLGKLQQFVEINVTGFRKILKKWDKRSRSTTKELYLARQVEVQPVFNRQLIADFSDIVAASLLDLTDLSTGFKFEGAAAQDVLDLQLSIERNMYSGPFREFELDLRKAVENSDEATIKDLVRRSDILGLQDGGRARVTRVLWKVIVDAPAELADLILTSVEVPFDFGFIDDINGRTCLHEAAAAGTLRLVTLCLERGSQKEKLDVYGRSALHYAAMHGHAAVCRRLLEAGVSPHVLDMDNCSPVVYATLKGSAECVHVLICDQCIAPQSLSPDSSLVPLSLASQHGYTDIVSLLLKEGAKCVPNTNGEFPIHLAAREGHADVCKLLLDQDGWDTADKYHEWTPLFHAARSGHAPCLRILLQAGAHVDGTDEHDHQAIHYAAWYGHRACVDLLLQAMPKELLAIPPNRIPALPRTTSDMRIDDPDSIPSLSLPPPIIPHRVYGHNYLDKNYLVVITVGLPPASDHRRSGKAIRFHPRLSDSILAQSVSLPSPNRLKMVITAGPGVNAPPYTIALPQQTNRDTFIFQVSSLKDFSLEFSIYPNFGTKTIGRAVAHPSFFHSSDGSFTSSSILDHRLHSIGEVSTQPVFHHPNTDVYIQVSFSAHVITPFQGITLEVGGAIETYWKSLTLPQGNPLHPGPQTVPPWRQSPRSMDSTHTSPSIQSAPASPSHAVTLSSLSGNYVYAVVQVTRDQQPVLYGEQLLPESSYDLGVADVTLAQFDALANRLDRGEQLIRRITSIQDWYRVLPQVMLPLSRFMQLLPVQFGLTLELALLPSQSINRHLDINVSVNAVFRTIRHTSSSLGGAFARRRIAFTSFSYRVCAALNWKQPNYPVFFSSRCGQASKDHGSTPPNPDLRDAGDDQYSSSVAEGVEFAKANNLLGVFFDSELLAHQSGYVH